MSKLHELLAVQDNLRNQAEATRADLKNTFEKKQHHFQKKLVTFKSLEEGKPDKIEEQSSLQTTVAKELEWIGEKLVKAMDVGHQIDIANLSAKADVILDDGTVLLKDVPSTSIMQLEKRVREVMDLVKAIPTLDPAKGFELDESEGAGIFKARLIERPRTEKRFDYVVMVGATDKHPAQVKELMVDKVSGTIVQQEWSSLITVAAKGDMLDRCEALLRAIKKAKSRANEIEVDVHSNKVGQRILDFVVKGAR